MTTTTTSRRIIHTPGGPADLKGSRKPASNPDGKTPVDLPTGKPKSLHDAKPAPDAPHPETGTKDKRAKP